MKVTFNERMTSLLVSGCGYFACLHKKFTQEWIMLSIVLGVQKRMFHFQWVIKQFNLKHSVESTLTTSYMVHIQIKMSFFPHKGRNNLLISVC